MAHPHSPRVAQDLVDAAGNHAPHEPEGRRPHANARMEDEGKAEDNGEGKVRTEGWDVAVYTELGTAYFQGAVCVRAEVDIAAHSGCSLLQHGITQAFHGSGSATLVKIRCWLV